MAQIYWMDQWRPKPPAPQPKIYHLLDRNGRRVMPGTVIDTRSLRVGEIIIKKLNDNPTRWWTVNELTAAIDLPRTSVGPTVARMANNKRLVRRLRKDGSYLYRPPYGSKL